MGPFVCFKFAVTITTLLVCGQVCSLVLTQTYYHSLIALLDCGKCT